MQASLYITYIRQRLVPLIFFAFWFSYARNRDRTFTGWLPANGLFQQHCERVHLRFRSVLRFIHFRFSSLRNTINCHDEAYEERDQLKERVQNPVYCSESAVPGLPNQRSSNSVPATHLKCDGLNEAAPGRVVVSDLRGAVSQIKADNHARAPHRVDRRERSRRHLQGRVERRRRSQRREASWCS